MVAREWGPAARWSSRTFAVVWAGIVLSGGVPFALGAALALLALWALQARARWRFAALARPDRSRRARSRSCSWRSSLGGDRPRAARGAARPGRRRVGRGRRGVELVLWRLFPGGGRFPFSLAESLRRVSFCVLGLGSHVERRRHGCSGGLRSSTSRPARRRSSCPRRSARTWRGCATRRSRSCILALSLRRWRPWPVCLVAFGLAVSWNLVAARRQLRARRVGSGRFARPTGRRDRLPAAAADTFVPGRGGGHGRPLGRGLPRRAGIPSPAAGSARTTSRATGAVRGSRRRGVPRAGCDRSASATSCSRTRRPTTARAARHACSGAAAPGCPVLPLGARDRVRRARARVRS